MSILDKILPTKRKSEYLYHIDNVDKTELKECNIGDYLTIWFPENKSLINLYRPGTHSGLGKVGNISGKFMKTIINHFDRGDYVEAQIMEISTGKCLIKCNITPAEKLKEEKDNNISSIREELSKPYLPKKPLQYKLFTRENFVLTVGDSLKLYLDNLQELESNIERIEIPIFHGDTVIGKVTGQTVCRKILRGIYSGYLTECSIAEIETQEKNLRIITIVIEFKN